MTTIGVRTLGVITLLVVAAASLYLGYKVGRRVMLNEACCQIRPGTPSVMLSLRELFRVTRFHSQIGQDRWVIETLYPDRTGYFVDVGSADGTLRSNTRALEERGWTGLCIDPFPTNMDGRTCRMFRDVVFSESGQRVQFRAASELGGIDDRIDTWRSETRQSPLVEFTTVTLAELLERANAPTQIDFMSLDIEGAELDALRGFPFETYRIGALAVEHNFEGQKRFEILQLLEQHGYRLAHSWQQDDFYLPASAGN